MHATRPRRLSTLALAWMVVTLPCASASAEDFLRIEDAMSADICQAALPAYDGNVRKRPLALVNEGVAGVFVTCAFSGRFNPETTRIGMVLVNTGTSAQEISCTLVDGPLIAIVPRLYAVRAISVPPGATRRSIQWDTNDADVTDVGLRTPAVSCLLAPGTGIVLGERVYREKF